MKRMNKLKGVMMAVLLLMTYILPVGTQVTWATEGTISYNSAASKVIAEDILEKGDYFTVQLIFDLQGVKLSDFNEDNVKQVGIQGGASDDEVDVVVNRTSSQGVMEINKLKYNGNGKDVTIAVRYGQGEIIDCQVQLKEVEQVISAGLAVNVGHNNTINVKAGETQQVQITLANESEFRSKEGIMKLSVTEKNTTAKNIKLTKSKYDIPELSAGESKVYNITLSIDKQVTRGIHELEVDVDGTKSTVKLKVDSDFMPPSLELSVSGTEGFKVNHPKDITINLKNIGQIAAKNVKLEIVPNEKVYVLGGSNVKYIENIASGRTQNVQIKLQVSDPSATTVPLQLKFSYTDDLGQKQEDSQYIYLNTEGALLNREVVIDKIIEPTGTFNPNQNFTLKFTVSAANGAKNVKLSVNGTEGIIAKSKNLFIIPEIKAGQKTQYSVTLAATSAAKSNAYPIEIKATYKLNNEEITISQYGSVNISNPKADEETGTGEDGKDGKKKGTPKVIVGEYKSKPVVVKAGEEFDLEIGFLNTNATKRVNNLKANLTVKEEGEKDTGNVFTPVGASNTFYIASLAPGQTEVKKIRLYTIPSAKPKTYQITIDMEYEDEKGYEVKTTEMIGIPVEQVTKLEVAEVQMDGLEVGRPCAVSATLYNTGKTDISNVMIQVEGEGFSVEENKMFIGNFEHGASEMYTPTIIPSQAGPLEGKIVIEYEDSTGQLQTLTHELTMDVMDTAPMPEDMGGAEMPEPETPSKLPTLLGVGVGIILAAIMTRIAMKKRKNKLAEMEIDED